MHFDKTFSILGIRAFNAEPSESYGLGKATPEFAHFDLRDFNPPLLAALIFSITGYLGMQVVLSLVRTFGAFFGCDSDLDAQSALCCDLFCHVQVRKHLETEEEALFFFILI